MRVSQPLTLPFIALMGVKQRTLTGDALNTWRSIMSVSARLTDDGQLGWMVDGRPQQPYQAASVCTCAQRTG